MLTLCQCIKNRLSTSVLCDEVSNHPILVFVIGYTYERDENVMVHRISGVGNTVSVVESYTANTACADKVGNGHVMRSQLIFYSFLKTDLITERF